MVFVARTCSFQERRSRPAARVFVLCDFGETQLKPISLPGHRSVNGIISWREGRQLILRLNVLSTELRRILVGLYLPIGNDFNEEDFRLQLTFDDGSNRTMHPAIENGAGKRYALLATVVRSSTQWNANRFDPPKLFASKNDLSQAHPVPTWWLQVL